ncbi:hypothetical protein RI367_005390 [Sorochytrium milnesiophthora]
MSIFTPLDQLSYRSLTNVALFLSVLCLVPTFGLPLQFAYLYRRHKKPLTLGFFYLSLLLLPASIDGFVAGIQEYLHAQSGTAGQIDSDSGLFLTCCYNQPWRTPIEMVCETCAAMYYTHMAIDRHALLANVGLIWLPPRFRQMLKALLVFALVAIIVAQACQSSISNAAQDAVAISVFSGYLMIDVGLSSATLRGTLRMRYQLQRISVRSLPPVPPPPIGATTSPSKLPAAAAAASGLLAQLKLKPPSSSCQVLAAAAEPSQPKVSKRHIFRRTRALIAIVVTQILIMLLWTATVVYSPPIDTLPSVINNAQIGTLMLRLYMLLSFVYLRKLVGLANDGATVQSVMTAAAALPG